MSLYAAVVGSCGCSLSPGGPLWVPPAHLSLVSCVSVAWCPAVPILARCPVRRLCCPPKSSAASRRNRTRGCWLQPAPPFIPCSPSLSASLTTAGTSTRTGVEAGGPREESLVGRGREEAAVRAAHMLHCPCAREPASAPAGARNRSPRHACLRANARFSEQVRGVGTRRPLQSFWRIETQNAGREPRP